jgi:hypothetical protein
MSEDPQIRDLVRRAHTDDRAPSFTSTLAVANARRRPRVWYVGAAVVIAAAAAVLVLWLHGSTPTRAPPPTPIALGMSTTSIVTPLDSLLVIPDTGLLATTPHFDEGAIP